MNYVSRIQSFLNNGNTKHFLENAHPLLLLSITFLLGLAVSAIGAVVAAVSLAGLLLGGTWVVAHSIYHQYLSWKERYTARKAELTPIEPIRPHPVDYPLAALSAAQTVVDALETPTDPKDKLNQAIREIPPLTIRGAAKKYGVPESTLRTAIKRSR